MNNLSTRGLEIIKILKKLNYPVSSLVLSEEIGCSTKTIQSEIKDINKQLKDTKIVSIRGVGYQLEGKIDEEEFNSSYIGNIDRIEFIIKTMINLYLNEKSSIKLEALADSMFISVSTVKNDLKEVKEILNRYNVNIVSKHKYGLGIDANISNIVKCIVDLCNRKDNELVLQDFLNEDVNNNIFSLKNKILKSLDDKELILSDIEFKNLCSTIYIQLSRINKNGYDDMIVYIIEEYRILRESIMNDDLNKEKITKAISLFCKNLKLATAIDISKDEFFTECLYNHINNLIKKDKLGISNYNVVNNDVKIKYPYAYELAKIAKKTIESELDLNIGEDEVSNIAVHVGGAVERYSSNKKIKVLRVIIVCASGAGTSMLINTKLQHLFKDRLEIVKIIPSYLIDYINALDVDFLISTMPLDYDKIPVITVSPFLTNKEIKIIEKFMDTGYVYEDVNIKDFFERGLFLINLDCKNKEEVLEYMSNALLEKDVIDVEMKNSYFEREKIATTEIGNMVAMPHGSKGSIKNNKIVVGILENPINWEYGKVKLVIMLALNNEKILDYEQVFSNIYNKLDTISKVVNICENKNYEKFIKLF
ncbi:MAG: PTS sugar transporter subunit IIA [Terrisporobacter sp.]|uniref:BglG family transcription antiterminator n=1 Tax=Terrisporobacter sp. TaxID=1965305 RepID=UPI002FC980D7